MSGRPRLFLIDGHAVAYRTYVALTAVGGGSRWITKRGEPTAGTYGFTSVLLRLLEDEEPEYLAVSFDVGPTFRDEIYPEYKATREKMPDDLRLQIERIRQVVDSFGIPILEAEGYEADDVLGTVARKAADEGVQVIILTGDRDLLQLADDNVVIRLAGQKLSEAEDYGPDEVRSKMGVPPDKVVEYKALVGDSSDNIPGVRGVGEKTATKLLDQYSSLEEIYEHLDQVQTRFRNKLSEAEEEAYLSRELAQIRTNVPVPFDLAACRARGYDRDQVMALFRELEFRSLMERIPDPSGAADAQQMALFVSSEDRSPSAGEEAVVVDDQEGLDKLVEVLEGAEHIAFDVETTSTDAMQAELVGISLAVDPEQGYYVPVGHQPAHAGGPQLDMQLVLEALRPALTDSDIPKVGHNLKYDFLILARYGLRARPLGIDTMIAEWLCDPGSRNLGLKNLAWVRLGVEMTEIQELIGSGKNQRTMAEVSIADAAPYAAADAAVCLQLMPKLQDELERKHQSDLFTDLEMPLVPILADMEMAGIGVDHSFLDEFAASLQDRLDDIEAQIHEHAGKSFNINSPQQLSEVLFDVLELEPPDRTRKTASGYYSTAASVLDQLRDSHPIVQLVLEHRELAKLKSTYAEALRDQVNRETGRVHTSYNQTGSVTGRLASSEPNLQNIPIRTELGRQIRKAFVAEEDNVLLAVDYSQIELRIVAHISQDQTMLQAFAEDQDIHATTAATVNGVELSDVTAEMRRQAKAVNFGLLYGMSAYGLTRSTELTLAEAEDFVEAYFERFPGVQRYLEETREQARQDGYVETLLGRRRYFPQLKEGGPPVSQPARARAEREAINAPIQGSAADIIKLAMLRLPDALQDAELNARMLLQVHDELVLEVSRAELEASHELISDVMQSAYELDVPLKTEAKYGRDWYDMEELPAG
ncbi:MAG: DNA polymerase I [Anaerolineales bacterium]|nr:DNA polymerase I [Anaerolineales bacterium]